VLFDEIEKAHPRMHGVLLSILDEGSSRTARAPRLLRAGGRRPDVERRREGDGRRRRPLGFGRDGGRSDASGSRRSRARALERRFSPEFLGRIDETVLFEELDPRPAEAIARLELRDLAMRARRAGGRSRFRPRSRAGSRARGFSPSTARGGSRARCAATSRRRSRSSSSRGASASVRDGIARARVESDRIVFESSADRLCRSRDAGYPPRVVLPRRFSAASIPCATSASSALGDALLAAATAPSPTSRLVRGRRARRAAGEDRLLWKDLDPVLVSRRVLSKDGREALKHLAQSTILERLAKERGIQVPTPSSRSASATSTSR
jgi:hypothetical protein